VEHGSPSASLAVSNHRHTFWYFQSGECGSEFQETVARLCDKHMHKVVADFSELIFGNAPVNWEEFSRDLSKWPEMAFGSFPGLCNWPERFGNDRYLGDFPLLFWVILVPDVPLAVFHELIRLNPNAIHYYAFPEASNIQHAQLDTIPPDILRTILDREGFQSCVTAKRGDRHESPLEFFIRSNPDSEQVKVILETKFSRIDFCIRTSHRWEPHSDPRAVGIYVESCGVPPIRKASAQLWMCASHIRLGAAAQR
jgi:hypothetical protein